MKVDRIIRWLYISCKSTICNSIFL